MQIKSSAVIKIAAYFTVSSLDKYHLEIPAEPWQGNPLKAKIIILSLNPGWQEKNNKDKSLKKKKILKEEEAAKTKEEEKAERKKENLFKK